MRIARRSFKGEGAGAHDAVGAAAGDGEDAVDLAVNAPGAASALCHKMVQATRDYDKSFELAIQHMSWNWNTDGKGDRQVPGHVVWEASPARLSAVRAEVLQALAE